MTYGLTDKQKEYLREAHHRWNFAEGAVRSGKSWLANNIVIPDRILSGVGKDGINLLMGVSLGNIERNVLVPMRDRFGDTMVGTIGGPDNTVNLFGERCYALGAEKATQVRKLQGAAVKFCYIDEAAGISPDVFEMLKSRLSFEYSECHAGLNPEGPRHWLKRFMDTPGLDIYRQHYTIDDNPTLPKSYVEQLKREYSGVFYDRYIKGLWTQAEGLVYPNADRDWVCQQVEPQGEPVYVSIDYGITNPFAALLWTVRDGVAYAFDEFGHDSRKAGYRMTDSQLYQALKEKLKPYYVETIVIDPSASSFIEEIKADGIYRVKPANNEVLPGIQNVTTAAAAGELKVCPACKEFIAELGVYAWDAKSAETKVLKTSDHYCDACRYQTRTVFRRMLPSLGGVQSYQDDFHKEVSWDF